MMRILASAVAAFGLLCGSAVLAQDYPAGPITLVVPFAAGSGTDAVARAVSQKLSERLKQPVLVDNKPVAGFDLTSWNGIFGPAGLPQPVVDRLNAELQVVLADRELQDRLTMIGFQVSPSKTPAEFARYVADQLAHWTTLIKQAGIKPE